MSYKQTNGWMEEVNGIPVRKRPVTTYSSPFDPIGYVFHYTVGCGSDLSSVFQSRNVSTHFSVDLVGVIYQYVPLGGKAWHADNANSLYWGVEHTAMPGMCELNDKQLEASAKLTAALVEYTKAKWGRDIPLKKIAGWDLVPGFHDHRDGDGYHWNLNGHTDHLYHWSWAKYLAVVTGAPVSDEMSDYERGMAAFADAARAGSPDKPPNTEWTAEKKQGYRDARLLFFNPVAEPGTTGSHIHGYTVTLNNTPVSGTTDAA